MLGLVATVVIVGVFLVIISEVAHYREIKEMQQEIQLLHRVIKEGFDSLKPPTKPTKGSR